MYNAPNKNTQATPIFLLDVIWRPLITGIGKQSIQVSNTISMLFIAIKRSERFNRYSMLSIIAGVDQKLETPWEHSRRLC